MVTEHKMDISDLDNSEIQGSSVRRQRAKRNVDAINTSQNSYFYQDSFIDINLQEKDLKTDQNQLAQHMLKNIMGKSKPVTGEDEQLFVNFYF